MNFPFCSRNPLVGMNNGCHRTRLSQVLHLYFRKQVLCSGDLPEGLSGACASRIGKTLYVFAGHCKEFGHSYNVSFLGLSKYNIY